MVSEDREGLGRARPLTACAAATPPFPPRGAPDDLAHALAGRRYRVRYGLLPAPCVDCPVDAYSAAAPVRASGPFEREIVVARDDVVVRAMVAQDRPVACIDVAARPVPPSADQRALLLDVQPVGDDPAMPLVVDAATGERLPIDPARLLDDTNTPCDQRALARLAWDENLRRWQRAHR